MSQFSYRGRTANGSLSEGVREAPGAEVLADLLQAEGIIPISIQPVKAAGASFDLRRYFPGTARKKVPLDEMILFCRQMQTLSGAGIPLIRALRGLAETSRSQELKSALGRVVEDLEGGRDLSRAFANQGEVFPELLASMVQVGENTGKLEEVFQELHKYLTVEKETLDRVKQALRYPAFVVIAIVVAIAVITIFVIPAFEKVFASARMELPLATRMLLATSRAATAYWPHLLGLGALAALALRRALQTEQGRFTWDRLKLRLPVAGSLVLRATMTRFSRAFAMSYSAGVPLVQALRITAQAIGNRFVASKIDQMRNSLERGTTLTQGAATTDLFPPLVLQMLAVGEETGQVDHMLREVADFYEREVDYDLKNLTAAIEPILVAFMGIVVLILALGVFLPMWNMTSMAKGG